MVHSTVSGVSSADRDEFVSRPVLQPSTGFCSSSAAAAAIALINSIGNLGGCFGPTMIGWLKDKTGSFTPGMFGLAGMLVLTGAIALLLPVLERRLGRVPGSGP